MRRVLTIYVSFIGYCVGMIMNVICFRFILIVGMWAARMLRTAATFKPMMTLTNPARNYCASIKPSVK